MHVKDLFSLYRRNRQSFASLQLIPWYLFLFWGVFPWTLFLIVFCNKNCDAVWSQLCCSHRHFWATWPRGLFANSDPSKAKCISVLSDLLHKNPQTNHLTEIDWWLTCHLYYVLIHTMLCGTWQRWELCKGSSHHAGTTRITVDVYPVKGCRQIQHQSGLISFQTLGIIVTTSWHRMGALGRPRGRVVTNIVQILDQRWPFCVCTSVECEATCALMHLPPCLVQPFLDSSFRNSGPKMAVLYVHMQWRAKPRMLISVFTDAHLPCLVHNFGLLLSQLCPEIAWTFIILHV